MGYRYVRNATSGDRRKALSDYNLPFRLGTAMQDVFQEASNSFHTHKSCTILQVSAWLPKVVLSSKGER